MLIVVVGWLQIFHFFCTLYNGLSLISVRTFQILLQEKKHCLPHKKTCWLLHSYNEFIDMLPTNLAHSIQSGEKGWIQCAPGFDMKILVKFMCTSLLGWTCGACQFHQSGISAFPKINMHRVLLLWLWRRNRTPPGDPKHTQGIQYPSTEKKTLGENF